MKHSSAETFVRTWMECENVKDVAEKLGVTRIAVYSRAAKMRKRGVKLPNKGYTPRALDVDSLNAIIEGRE